MNRDSALYSLLSPAHQQAIGILFDEATRRLDSSPRFRLFTLHGQRHLSELFRIADLIIQGGVKLTPQEAYLLGAAICVHDIGMIVALNQTDLSDLFNGLPYAPDPAVIEEQIREQHHNLIDIEFRNGFDFFSKCGITPAEMSQIIDISKCHRKIVLKNQSGFIQYLGALLRVIDELDIGPNRAPADVLTDIRPMLDPTSAWHWYKHSITERWDLHNNVTYSTEGGQHRIAFNIRIHPTSAKSVPYWLNQIRRPLTRALVDDGCAQYIKNRFGVGIFIETDADHSSPGPVAPQWIELEEYALSAGRKRVLLIDDEVRKMEDLMVPTMDDFHVLFASSAKDAFDKLSASPIDLAIVDIQIGSGFIWGAEETGDYKQTGILIAQEILKRHPATKVAFLTGSRHDFQEAIQNIPTSFVARKPISGTELKSQIAKALPGKR